MGRASSSELTSSWESEGGYQWSFDLRLLSREQGVRPIVPVSH